MSEHELLWAHIQDLRQMIDELFRMAAPGPRKNALWQRYQSITSDHEPPDLVAQMQAMVDDPAFNELGDDEPLAPMHDQEDEA